MSLGVLVTSLWIASLASGPSGGDVQPPAVEATSRSIVRGLCKGMEVKLARAIWMLTLHATKSHVHHHWMLSLVTGVTGPNVQIHVMGIKSDPGQSFSIIV